MQDANWNTTALVNTTGTVQERYTYTPFGQVTFRDSSGSTLSGSAKDWIFLHQGGERIAAGDYEFRNRVYSPSLGRWLSNDPLGFDAGDQNWYRAIGNNPGNGLDPSGLHKGHHKVVSFIRNIVSAEALEVFESEEARIWNQFYTNHNSKSLNDISHPEYTEAVKKEFNNFKLKYKINPSKMSADDAKRFVEHLDSLPKGHIISKFNLGVKKEAEVAMEIGLAAEKKSGKMKILGKAMKAGGKVAKLIPVISTGAVLLGWAGDANAKGFANGTANSVLDAVPFVGNFKVFIEIFTGDFIPDLPEKTSGETGQDQEELPKGYYFEMVYDAFVANPGPKFDINPNR